MKRLAFCLSALLAIVVALFLPAQLTAAPVRTQTAIDFVLAENSGCSVTPESYLLAIVNASSIYDCDATGGGTATALCVCDGGTIRGAITDDIASYVLITFAGQQSITATGAGNDVSLVAADDVLLTPTDALTAAVGGAASIVTTAGAVTITAGGTTQDVGVNSVDDIILTPTDDLTIAAADIVAGATTTLAFDAAGGTDELGIAENSVSVSTGIAFRLVGSAAPPVACAAGTAGTIYYDSSINKFCVCNATAYVLVDDATTTTGCS